VQLPEGRSIDGLARVKVIAGGALGLSAVIETRTPILYLHLSLEQGARFEQAVPKTHNALAYVIEGTGDFNGTEARGNQVALLDRGGERLLIANAGAPRLSVLLFAGEPIGQPVARYGPFVMNSKEELVQAVDDYREGRMGLLA